VIIKFIRQITTPWKYKAKDSNQYYYIARVLASFDNVESITLMVISADDLSEVFITYIPIQKLDTLSAYMKNNFTCEDIAIPAESYINKRFGELANNNMKEYNINGIKTWIKIC
jgi:hypothetical protein